MVVFGDLASYSTMTIVEGSVVGQDDINLLASSNDQRLVVQDTSGSGSQPLQTIVDLQLDTDYSTVDADDEVDIRVESHAAEPNVTGRVYLKAQNNGQWVLWNQYPVLATNDGDTFTRCIPSTHGSGFALKDYVASDGRIDVRLEMTRTYTIGSTVLTSKYDFVQAQVIDN